MPQCMSRLLAHNVVRRDAVICLKLRDKPTLRRRRQSGVVDPERPIAAIHRCNAT